jgi:hypothetical protein
MGLSRSLGAMTACLLAACTAPIQGTVPRPLPLPGENPTQTASISPLFASPPPITAPTPAPTSSPTGRTLYGLVTLRAVSLPYFGHNQAFHILTTSVGGALVSFATLEQSLLRQDGAVVSTSTDSEGRFAVVGHLPSDRALVATVALAGGHRLSALALPSARDLTVDEASSMVTELARWQLPTAPFTDGRTTISLADLTADSLNAIYHRTLALLKPELFTPVGSPPIIENLQAGSGFLLRHTYVAAFGAQVTRSSSTEADALSDGWRGILGYRPLAITVLAGGGPGGEDELATQANLAGPTDAQPDAVGNIWIAEHDAHAIRVVPAVNRGPWLARNTNLTVGHLYTLLGGADFPRDRASFEALYAPLEATATQTPESAPWAVDPLTHLTFPLFAPRRLLLEPGPLDVPSVYVASDDGNRVFWIPASDGVRYGRRVRAGRIYTLAGSGAEATQANPATGDGGPAALAKLSKPSALVRDSRGDLFVLDAGAAQGTLHGTVRVVRFGDGHIVGLPLTLGGLPLRFPGATDLRLIERVTGNLLFIADPARHVIWRATLPPDLAALAQDPIAPIEVQAALGSADGGALAASPIPDLFAGLGPIAKSAVRLLSPNCVALDAAGQLLVAEGEVGRLRLLVPSGGTGPVGVWTIGGLLLTPPGATRVADVLTGDARLAAFPGTAALTLEADGNLLVADRRANVIRRLWLRRGAF